MEPTFPTGIWSDKLGKFPTIWVVLCSRISDQNLIGIQAVLTDSARKTWGTDKTLDIAQMIWVASLSNASGHRWMYVQHEMRKDLPAERSPAKSEGVAGLRKFHFRLADGAGEGVGHRTRGFGAFWACAGPSLDSMCGFVLAVQVIHGTFEVDEMA